MIRFALIAAALGLGAVGCAPPQSKDTAAAAATCPDDGPRLAHTGLCQGRAVNYFDPARLTTTGTDLPEGCTWVVNETPTPDPEEAILYNALRCNDKTTKLEFSAGARSASLGWGESGLFDTVPKMGEEGAELVRIFTLEGQADPKAMILEMAKGLAAERQVSPAEIAACAVRPAGEGFPADAVVVDVSDAFMKANKIGPYDGLTDGPEAGAYGVCGDYGFTTDSQRYWMIRDGYAWFVDLGQDTPDFDAGSLTVFRKGADGAWGPVQ